MIKAYLRSFPGARLTALIPAFYIAFIVLSGRWAFLGDAYLTLELLPNAFIYVFSLVAALSAYDTVIIARPESSALLATLPRGRAVRFIPGLMVAALSVILHTSITVGMFVLGGITDPRVGWGIVIWTVAVQNGSFVVVALLGSVIAFLAGPRIAPFLAFLVTFVYVLAASVAGGSPMIRALGSSIRQIWWTWNPEYKTVQSLLLIIAGCVLMLALMKFRPQLNALSVGDHVRVVAAGLGLSIGFMLPEIPYQMDVAPPPSRTLCTEVRDPRGGTLEFCGYAEDERYLPYLERVIILGRDFLAEADILLDDMPTRFESEGPDVSVDPDPDVVYLGLPSVVINSRVVHAPTEVGIPELELIANRFAIPPTCLSESAQDRLFMHDSEAIDAYGSLISTVFDAFDAIDGTLSPEDFATNYRELAVRCAE